MRSNSRNNDKVTDLKNNGTRVCSSLPFRPGKSGSFLPVTVEPTWGPFLGKGEQPWQSLVCLLEGERCTQKALLTPVFLHVPLKILCLLLRWPFHSYDGTTRTRANMMWTDSRAEAWRVWVPAVPAELLNQPRDCLYLDSRQVPFQY